MGFSRQDYWSGLPFPSPGDLPNPGIGPRSPALQADTLLSEPPGKPLDAPEIMADDRVMMLKCWEEPTQQVWLLVPCVSPRKPGALTNPQPTLGSVVLRRPVMSVMDGVVFTWSSGPCPAGLSGSFAQMPRLMMCTWFHCWSLEFQLLWLIDSWMGLCDPSPVNTWTLRGVRVFSMSNSAVLHWRQSLS